MDKSNHYQVVKSIYITEKSSTLARLHEMQSNKSLRKCNTPKSVFVVASSATKPQIAAAIEYIFADKNVKVRSVNTVNVKPKNRRVRGIKGVRSGFKKAIITFEPGHGIDQTV